VIREISSHCLDLTAYSALTGTSTAPADQVYSETPTATVLPTTTSSVAGTTALDTDVAAEITSSNSADVLTSTTLSTALSSHTLGRGSGKIKYTAI